MLQEVRVKTVPDQDVRGQELLEEIHSTLGITIVTAVHAVKVYRLEGFDQKTADFFAQQVLVAKSFQEYVVNKPLISNAVKTVEIAVKPGVMNPEVHSLFKATADLQLCNLNAADTSWEYHFFGELSDEQLQHILDRLLVNKTVDCIIDTPPKTLCFLSDTSTHVHTVPIVAMDDDALVAFSKKNQLYLNLEEMKVIQDYFKTIGRNPYDAELETIAQTWSEHCGHKTFKAKLVVDGQEKEPLFTRLKKEAAQWSTNVVSAFIDNAGAYRFYDGYAILAKVETHNSPSAIEPYGGAATGSGGVFRDIMGTGQGAKIIASTDMFCFAPPNIPTDALPPGCLHPHYLLRRVVAGVRDYGNRMGIPTNNGSVHFHNDFRAKPTVIVGAYGIAPEKQCIKGTPQKGDYIFVVGGKTGRDGIHGATFSSGEMTASTMSVNASAVQIGNPIEQKRMTDALLACRDQELIRAITDCGAGGFSSAIGEIAADNGAQVWLEKAPLKYQGLEPWEIWISESQERMICAVAPEHAQMFTTLCKDYNVETTIIGIFTNDKKLCVTYKNAIVCDLTMEFLHDGMPQRIMIANKPKKEFNSIEIPTIDDWIKTYCKVMSHWNICSKEPIVRQYDHSVQGTNVLPPYAGVNHNAPNDAVVLTPLLGKSYGLIISHGMNPILTTINPYKGSLWAIVETLANLVAVGGNYQEAALIDNFIWPYPDEHSLWELYQAVNACVDAMQLFNIPFISGKDSLSSTYRYPSGEVLKIPPVLCVSAFGKIPDSTKTVSADFKKNDSCVVLIGNLDIESLGGSAYADTLKIDEYIGVVPDVTINDIPTIFSRLYNHIIQGTILACHDVSEGGIAVTLAEMCFGGDIGADIDLSVLGEYRPDFLLFNETAGCFLVEVEKEKMDLLTDLPHHVLGKTKKERVIDVVQHQQLLFSVQLETLLSAWQKPMKEVFNQ